AGPGLPLAPPSEYKKIFLVININFSAKISLWQSYVCPPWKIVKSNKEITWPELRSTLASKVRLVLPKYPVDLIVE
ncbi:MAG TPA: hypothetical protein DEF27_03985, partial [Oscillatoriales bacterium UBA8482]|nr:hypothetical protein [Oscillatoriales bacterium UBA8482]